MERFTVSLDDYIKYIMKKWMIMVGCVLLFVILFALSATMLGKEIVIPPSEEYLELKEQEASFASYIENSPVMKINATSVHESIVYISNISEMNSLKNHIESGTVWAQLNDEMFRQYFSDLVTWYDNGNQIVEIKIQHHDEQQCGEIARYLSEELRKYDVNLDVLQGDLRVASDESIADVQSWYKNRLDAIEGQLEYARAGYTIEAGLPVAIVTGALVGGLTAIVALFFGFLINHRKSQ